MHRLKVKNDFIFQRIFGRNENKEILMSFLNAFIGNDKINLMDLEIIDNTKLEKDRPDDKLGILDVRAKLQNGEQVNVEIQLVNQYNMDKRTLFYWSKLFTEQLSQGESYNKLKKTITINILDFNYLLIPNYHTIFHLWEDKIKDYKLTDILEIHFVEIPKFQIIEHDLKNPIDRWLIFIDGFPKEMIDMAIKNDPAIEKAEKVLNYLSTDEETIRLYELREKEIRDELNRIDGAKEEGRLAGKVEGKEEGIVQVVKNMLSSGADKNFISQVTGFDIEKINMIGKE